MTLTDKEKIDRITMVCDSDEGVKLGYDETTWTDKEKLEQIMRILGKTTQTDKEKIDKALKEIDNFMKFADEMPEPIHPIRYEKLLKEIKKTLKNDTN